MMPAWLDKIKRRAFALGGELPRLSMSATRSISDMRSTGRFFEAAEIVTSLYQSILRRPPDWRGLTSHARSLRQGAPLDEIVQSFMSSTEFASVASSIIDRFPLDSSGPQRVDLPSVGDEQSDLWPHVAEVWSSYGTNDPYWSVLTDERYRAKNMGNTEVLEAFYASGANNIGRFEAWLARNELPLGQDMVCAEYGCGVGRCTLWLARKFRHVDGLNNLACFPSL
jgi:hypothetical protein